MPLFDQLWELKEVITIILGLSTVYWKMDQRICSIEQRCVDVYDPFFNQLYRDIAKKVISPHTVRLDAIIRKGLEQGFEFLSEDEVNEYKDLLQKQIEETSGEEAFLYAFLKNGIEPVRKQSKIKCKV